MTQPNMPADFFWGNSVSSMQTEGAWQEDGKGLSVYDVRPATDHTMDWHDAIDEYHRYAEDLDLMADMGMNMYRMLHIAAQAVSDANHLLAPFLPHSAQKVWEQDRTETGTGTQNS